MTTKQVRAAVGCIVILAGLAGTAIADQSLYWSYQMVDQSPSGPDVALAMRGGSTWPTVFYDGNATAGPGQVMAASLTPVGWLRSGLTAFESLPVYPQAAAGSDGRVGVVFLTGDDVWFAQSTAGGWASAGIASVQNSSGAAPALDYLSANRPAVAYASDQHLRIAIRDGLAWDTSAIAVQFSGQSPSDVGDRLSLAVDSLDRPTVAYVRGAEVNVALRNPVNGAWVGSHVTAQTPSVRGLSLGYGLNDAPGLAILTQEGTLHFATYNIQQGAWQVAQIASDVQSQRVQLAFDAAGHPAVAYLNASDQLVFRSDRGAGWATYILDPNAEFHPDSMTDAAAAFDSQNQPVIAYLALGGVALAYDPQAPEPAVGVLLLALAALATRRPNR